MPTILLIEDESVLARNIEIALTRAGYRVSHAASAQSAQILVDSVTIDLVLADINIEDGNGLDFVDQNKVRLANVPLIVMTGQDSVINRERTDNFPVSVFLAKPFALSRLCEVVNALLEESNPQTKTNSRPNQSVVMYSHDTIGLGHMRRNVAIAGELVKRIPNLSVLLLVGCPKGLMFETDPGIDYVKLPSLTKLGRNHFKPGSLRLDSETTRAVRMGIIERVVSTLRPDILLVDHEPAGVWDELKPTLQRIRKECSTTVMLGLRDVLDDPDLLRTRWSQAGTDSLIREYYDHVLIYGNSSFYPSAKHYGLVQLKPNSTHYCGVVTNAKPSTKRRRPNKPAQVVVAGGGGRDAYPLIETTLSAYELIPPSTRPVLTVVSGPLLEAELRNELAIRAKKLGAIFHEMVSDFSALLNQADLLITMAGYNSVNESLVQHCPLVVVPRVGPSSEQRIRAAKLAEHQLGRVIYREDLTPEKIAEAMCADTPLPPRLPRSMLEFTGSQVAAKLIAAHLNKSTIPSSSVV